MKKFLLIVPIVALLAAGCNSSNTTQTTPAPQQQVIQNPTPAQTQPINNKTDLKTYTNDTLFFSVQYPSSWIVDMWGPSETNPVYNKPSFSNPNHAGQVVTFELTNCPSADLAKCIKDTFVTVSNNSSVKQFKSSTGLTGVLYDMPTGLQNVNATGGKQVQVTVLPEKAVMFMYPNNVEPDANPTKGIPGTKNAAIFIYLRNSENTIPSEQTDAFTKIINSFKFTNTTAGNNSVKIYASNYGYQFSYSSDYILEANSPKKVGLRSKSDNATDAYGNKTPADITIEYFNDLTELPYYQASIKNLDDYVAQSGSAKSMYNITSYKNKNGVLVYSFTNAGLKSVHTELMLHNSHYYQISFFKRETGDKLSASENDVLKSFIFTK